MRSQLAVLLSLPLLFAACSDAPAGPDPAFNKGQSQKADNSSGLYRIESPMFPFYTRTEPPSSVGGFAYHTDEWAAIVFYRDPSCVPAGFNLFEFYHIPFAFSCTSRVDGFALHVEPLGITPPKISQLHGDAVPIWFVPWDAAMQAAVAAGVLTRAQLEAMPGLRKGTATHFREHLTTIENHPAPMINITARGFLESGESFRYNVNWPGLTVADVKNVKIEFD